MDPRKLTNENYFKNSNNEVNSCAQYFVGDVGQDRTNIFNQRKIQWVRYNDHNVEVRISGQEAVKESCYSEKFDYKNINSGNAFYRVHAYEDSEFCRKLPETNSKEVDLMPYRGKPIDAYSMDGKAYYSKTTGMLPLNCNNGFGSSRTKFFPTQRYNPGSCQTTLNRVENDFRSSSKSYDPKIFSETTYGHDNFSRINPHYIKEKNNFCHQDYSSYSSGSEYPYYSREESMGLYKRRHSSMEFNNDYFKRRIFNDGHFEDISRRESEMNFTGIKSTHCLPDTSYSNNLPVGTNNYDQKSTDVSLFSQKNQIGEHSMNMSRSQPSDFSSPCNEDVSFNLREQQNIVMDSSFGPNDTRPVDVSLIKSDDNVETVVDLPTSLSVNTIQGNEKKKAPFAGSKKPIMKSLQSICDNFPLPETILSFITHFSHSVYKMSKQRKRKECLRESSLTTLITSATQDSKQLALLGNIFSCQNPCGFLVLFYMPFEKIQTSLQKTAAFFHLDLFIVTKPSVLPDKWCTTVVLNGTLIAELEAPGRDTSRTSAIEKAFSFLRHHYYTIEMKRLLSTSNKIVNLMGEVVERNIPRKDRGFSKGPEGSGLNVIAMHNTINKYKMNPMDIEDLVFSSGMPKKKRKSLELFAIKQGLVSQIYGSKQNRYVVVSKRDDLWAILNYLTSNIPLKVIKKCKYRLHEPGKCLQMNANNFYQT